MKFDIWWKYRTATEKRRMAKHLGCSFSTLRQAGQGHYRVSPQLALRIERYTQGDVSRHDLRPDIYPAEQN